VASGQSFPLALVVRGNFQFISGQVVACKTGIPVDQCFGSGQFTVTPSFFSGAPGTFNFTAQGTDCQGPEDFYFVARLSITFRRHFPAASLQSTDDHPLQDATGPVLQVSPATVTSMPLRGSPAARDVDPALGVWGLH